MLVWYILQTVGLAVFSNTGADAAAHATIAFIFVSVPVVYDEPMHSNGLYFVTSYSTRSTSTNFSTSISEVTLMIFFSSIAWSPLIVTYTVEILPYQIRAKGMTFFSFVISLTLIFNQYVNPIALKDLEWKYYVRRLVLRVISLRVAHERL